MGFRSISLGTMWGTGWHLSDTSWPPDAPSALLPSALCWENRPVWAAAGSPALPRPEGRSHWETQQEVQGREEREGQGTTPCSLPAGAHQLAASLGGSPSTGQGQAYLSSSRGLPTPGPRLLKLLTTYLNVSAAWLIDSKSMRPERDTS